ncbi:mechanosensitive ion channel family protein [Thalassotalea sp. LPB0316]|uniref:mechanosensitive ion channel family protein n=1 Tax=Thalassotalea sp. LPB0316 TaxID=2769490 RepID=UPI0018685925|nr:mechanosensitive ion channel family protein [Thalassotalea sp. LPB0316]QOL25938.1 mechanosensitive ion channel family protein [Thalassotalea sp. LPB0316]
MLQSNQNETASVTSLAPSELLKEELNQVTYFYQLIVEFFANYSFQIVGALLIFLLGYYIAGKVAKLVLKLCLNQKLDITLSKFLASTAKMIVVIMVLIVALSKLGISVTPFVAAIGAISLGASLAFQGLLSNYAAGFNIILTRPFVVGDTIEVQGVKGVVKEVLLAYTVLADEDDVDITIPNKHIVGEILHNSKEKSLLELNVGISYDDNPVAVADLVKATIVGIEGLEDESKCQVGISEFADSAINIEVRVWVPTTELFAFKYKANKAIYLALEQHNITIPFPQRDVHLVQQAS